MTRPPQSCLYVEVVPYCRAIAAITERGDMVIGCSECVGSQPGRGRGPPSDLGSFEQLDRLYGPQLVQVPLPLRVAGYLSPQCLINPCAAPIVFPTHCFLTLSQGIADAQDRDLLLTHIEFTSIERVLFRE